MRIISGTFLVGMAAILAACGVPREAGSLVAQQAAAAMMPAEDLAVRSQVAAQDAAWATLSQLLRKSEFGGIRGVDPQFVQLVDQAAALAKREHDLISQNQDDLSLNRQSLQQFNDLWHSADRYLNQ